MIDIFRFAPLIAGILSLTLAFLLIANRQFNRINTAFILLMIIKSLSSITEYSTYTSDFGQFHITVQLSIFFNGLSFLAILYYVLVLSGFISNLNKRLLGLKVRHIITITISLFVVAQILLLFTDVFVSDRVLNEFGYYETIWNTWMYLPQIFIVISIASVFAMLFSAYSKAEMESQKDFLRLNIAGTMNLAIAGPFLGLILPMMGLKTGPLIEYVNVITVFIYFYALTKYQYDTIHDLNISLEQKVEDRTRHLRETQARLVQSEKMAALNKLVAGIAHELNTPIGALTSAQDTLKRAAQKINDLLADNEDKQLKNSLKVMKTTTDVVVEGSERVANIVRRMKSFSQLDEADLQTVDIHVGIRDTLAVFTPELKHEVTVKEDFGDLPLITCYPARLNQLILFLLDNANRAIEDSGEIQIRTKPGDGNIEIAVRDDGIGIPEENLEKIFDPGFTTWGVGVGVGLGLSIAYQIVEEHKGKIIVNSSEGNGTEVVIHLPVG